MEFGNHVSSDNLREYGSHLARTTTHLPSVGHVPFCSHGFFVYRFEQFRFNQGVLIRISVAATNTMTKRQVREERIY